MLVPPVWLWWNAGTSRTMVSILTCSYTEICSDLPLSAPAGRNPRQGVRAASTRGSQGSQDHLIPAVCTYHQMQRWSIPNEAAEYSLRCKRNNPPPLFCNSWKAAVQGVWWRKSCCSTCGIQPGNTAWQTLILVPADDTGMELRHSRVTSTLLLVN